MPSCDICRNDLFVDIRKLPGGVEGGCVTCRVFLDALDAFEEYSNVLVRSFLDYWRPSTDGTPHEPFLRLYSAIENLRFEDIFLGLFRNVGRFASMSL